MAEEIRLTGEGSIPQVVAAMTLEEKARFVAGASFGITMVVCTPRSRPTKAMAGA